MKEVKVKIIKSSGQDYWYNKLIGETFEVLDIYPNSYVLKEDYQDGFRAPWRHIKHDDCEIVGNKFKQQNQ